MTRNKKTHKQQQKGRLMRKGWMETIHLYPKTDLLLLLYG